MVGLSHVPIPGPVLCGRWAGSRDWQLHQSQMKWKRDTLPKENWLRRGGGWGAQFLRPSGCAPKSTGPALYCPRTPHLQLLFFPSIAVRSGGCLIPPNPALEGRCPHGILQLATLSPWYSAGSSSVHAAWPGLDW